jgi:uncharacterized Tic20 family protein
MGIAMSDQPLPDQMADDPVFMDVPTSERQWAMFAHLSALVAIWMGGMGFLGPLIVWLIKKDEMRFVDDQGKEALNFQLNVVLLTVILGIIAVPLIFLTLGFGVFLLVPLALVLGALVIVMPIVAAMKANAGETYRYPFIIRLMK